MSDLPVGPLIWARADPPDLAEGSALDAHIAAGRIGGVVVFDVPPAALAEAVRRWQSAAPARLFVAIDNERGPGQQLRGELRLPPLAALGAVGDPALAREHGRLTALGSRQFGVNVVFAPVLDVYSLPSNPIVGARSFGAEPAAVAALGCALIEGLQAGGVLACGKHFPGHGHTAADSHERLPAVDTPRAVLEARELVPFRAAAAAGVDAMMTAHVSYAALDGDTPATLSPPIVTGILREQLGYEGLVLTDALSMGGVSFIGEREAARRALAAGCDVLLIPTDVGKLHADLSADVASGAIPAQHVERALRRVAAARARLAGFPDEPAPDAAPFAERLAQRAVRVLREGELWPLPAGTAPVVLLASEPGRTGARDGGAGFARVLVEAWPGCRVFPLTDGLSDAAREAAAEAPTVVAVCSAVGAYKGTAGLLPGLRDSLAALPASNQVWCLFGAPPLAELAPAGASVVCAWGSDGASQVAAAELLLRAGR